MWRTQSNPCTVPVDEEKLFCRCKRVHQCAAVPKSFELCEKGGKSTPEKQNIYILSAASASPVCPDATFLLHERAG